VDGFEQGPAADLIRANNTQVAREGKALRVTFQAAEWPNVTFSPRKPWDWSAHSGLAFDVANPGAESLAFSVRVDDDPAADGVNHCRTGSGTAQPGKTVHVVTPLGLNPMDVGMRGLPMETNGLTSLGSAGAGAFDLRHITAFQVFMHAPSGPKTLVLSNFRLISMTASLDGIVDAWGQYAKQDWPGKLHSESDFAERRNAEAEELQKNPVLPGLDRFGGWAAGPALRATGWFRTEKVGGKWWLVTPEGRLFFSLGMDCVNSDGKTFLTGREKMFARLPERNGPLGRFYGRVSGAHSGPVKEGETFDFLGANLERKYGPGAESTWRDLSLRRLRAWGFNTIGNWSDPALWASDRVPYVVTLGIGGNHARVASGQDYWGTMHDPFDPQFGADARTAVSGVPARVTKDPWCLGWFIDNEISWGGGGTEEQRCGLALGSLALDAASSPAKRALVGQLRASYSDVAALNAAWGTSFAGWDAVSRPARLAGPMNAARTRDLRAFVRAFAAQYFRTVRDAMKQAAPNHLYLGCRFAWTTPEVADAGAEYCDVVSFNIYQPKLDPARSAFFASLNKPCIIGEFHFGALDRGMFHTGLVATANQQERAATYVSYVRSVLDDPSFVGCHWFQYVDEPLTGRWFDGENYNIGFLTVTDTPYPEMVRAAKQVHGEAYARRYKGAGGQVSRR
jgi:hypothetical protein